MTKKSARPIAAVALPDPSRTLREIGAADLSRLAR